MAVRPARYRAFISYSHADKVMAAWLHRALESYPMPRRLVGAQSQFGPAPRRLTPIFRDRDELSASGDLGGVLSAALKDSLFLIVICSPDAARSRWVNEEILTFKRAHGEERVLALIVAGTPNVSSDNECFPPGLRFRLGADGQATAIQAEPIAADLRPSGDGRRLAKLKLIAGLAGVRLDDLVQRETHRRLRRLALVAGGSAIGMVVTGALAIYANAARIEADHQRAVAEKEAATARATSDYLVGTFALANPATENPRTITALTILDRSAARARAELADQPVVQARLIDTLGQAYNNLGLYDESRLAIEGSTQAIAHAGPDGASALLTLAQSQYQQGQFDEALEALHQGEALLGPDGSQFPEVRARAAVIEGEVRAGQGDTKRGVAAFDRALAYYRSAPKVDPRKIAVALQNRGLLLSDDAQYAAAEDSLTQAIAISEHVLGPNHLITGQGWFTLAQNDLLAGKPAVAETRIAAALAIERKVLDADNPILADSLSLQGRVLHAQHKLPQAEASLRQAVAIYRKAFGKPHYLIGITEVYLALVQADRGATAEALATLDDAKHNYDVGYGKIHANHGDLLVNRATILAHVGRMAEARADCAAGLKILGDTLGPDANYTKLMTQTCADLKTG